LDFTLTLLLLYLHLPKRQRAVHLQLTGNRSFAVHATQVVYKLFESVTTCSPLLGTRAEVTRLARVVESGWRTMNVN